MSRQRMVEATVVLVLAAVVILGAIVYFRMAGRVLGLMLAVYLSVAYRDWAWFLAALLLLLLPLGLYLLFRRLGRPAVHRTAVHRVVGLGLVPLFVIHAGYFAFLQWVPASTTASMAGVASLLAFHQLMFVALALMLPTLFDSSWKQLVFSLLILLASSFAISLVFAGSDFSFLVNWWTARTRYLVHSFARITPANLVVLVQAVRSHFASREPPAPSRQTG